jgi:hypothetical protein
MWSGRSHWLFASGLFLRRLEAVTKRVGELSMRRAQRGFPASKRVMMMPPALTITGECDPLPNERVRLYA